MSENCNLFGLSSPRGVTKKVVIVFRITKHCAQKFNQQIDLLVHRFDCLTHLGYVSHNRRDYSTLSWVEVALALNWQAVLVDN